MAHAVQTHAHRRFIAEMQIQWKLEETNVDVEGKSLGDD